MKIIRVSESNSTLGEILNGCKTDPVFLRRSEELDAVVLSMSAFRKLTERSDSPEGRKETIEAAYRKSVENFGPVYEKLALYEQKEKDTD